MSAVAECVPDATGLDWTGLNWRDGAVLVLLHLVVLVRAFSNQLEYTAPHYSTVFSHLYTRGVFRNEEN